MSLISSKRAVIFLVLLLGVLSVGYFYFKNSDALNPSAQTVVPSSTPANPVEAIFENLTKDVANEPITVVPFAELTIPYLRAKNFTSQLGTLEKYQDTGTFTSYLTNYTSDGLKINGLLTIPKGEQPAEGWPAIVFVHGYIPPTLYKTTERYIDHVNFFARNGFVVFKIDLRGHHNSEGRPGGAYYSSDYISDTLHAYSALEHADFVNPQGIGLWGHSMAGNVVFRTLAVKPDIPAAVIWAGAVYTYADQQEFGIDDNSYRPPTNDTQRQQERQRLRDTHGDFSPDSAFWKQVAATNYLSDMKTPLQIHHAVDDTVVNVGYSRNLMKLMDVTPIEHELFEYPSGGHNLTGGSFSQAMQRSVEFYKEKLK